MVESPGSLIQATLAASMTASDALTAANQLCEACVETLGVDGASLSLIHGGTTHGTFGSSSAASRRIDEFQFTYGDGPCLDAVSSRRPVLVADLSDSRELRWPAFRDGVLGAGIFAVFALPVALVARPVGALDLYRREAGPLTSEGLTGGLFAAELAALPLLDLIAEVDWNDAAQGGRWEQLASLERVEVYQATGMLIAALDVDPVEALVRLRAYAFSHGMTASEVAYAIVDGRMPLDGDDWQGSEGG